MKEKASKAILQEPFKFWIRTGWFLRLFRIKRIPLYIYPIHYGTMVKISGKLDRLKTTSKDSINENPVKTGFDIIRKDAKLVSRLIAYAILNSGILNFLFSRPLSWYLYCRLDSETGDALTTIVLERSKVGNFLRTIISLIGLDVLAPKREMSPNGTGETIAPGE
jgi:hypothetical protein